MTPRVNVRSSSDVFVMATVVQHGSCVYGVMRLRVRELKQLIEAARRTKTMDFEWTAETCRLLQKGGGVDEEARAKVTKIVEEVEGEFRRRADKWRAVGFDYEEVWPLYERLLAAVELLAERPDKAAAQRLCDTLRAIKVEVEEIAIKHLLGL